MKPLKQATKGAAMHSAKPVIRILIWERKAKRKSKDIWTQRNTMKMWLFFAKMSQFNNS